MFKQLFHEIKQSGDRANGLHAISYFTYSLLLPKTATQKGTIIGNFIIENIGSVSLESPFICLKIEPKTGELSAKLGGDIQYDRRLNPLEMETWQYLHDDAAQLAEEKGEFWLKPTHVSKIEPRQKLFFANFQFKFSTEEQRSYKIYGFFYCKQFLRGIKSLNNIIIHV